MKQVVSSDGTVLGGAFGVQSAFQPMHGLAPKESSGGVEKRVQKRVVYYSDFEINLNEWKIEYDSIQIYAHTLENLLGPEWKVQLGNLLYTVVDELPSGVEKSAWEVVLEYTLLTNTTTKEPLKRTEELAQYFGFYGYEVGDVAAFNLISGVLFEKAGEADKAVGSFKSLDHTYQLMQKEKQYSNAREVYHKYATDIPPHKKSAITKYVIMGRVVTPLMVANERVTETWYKEEDVPMTPEASDQVEERMQRMEICDKPKGEYDRQSKSLKLRGSVVEMQKIESAQHDVFSVGVLNAILCYVDLMSLKQDAPAKYIVIGNFPVVILEIGASELKSIYRNIDVTMSYENLNLRIMKPFKRFYNALISIVFKYGLKGLRTLSKSDFTDAAMFHLYDIWTPALKGPTEAFYGWFTQMAFRSNLPTISDVFDSVKCKMMAHWDTEVVLNSIEFKRSTLSTTPDS